ncbi:MAG: Asp23/Gls24 family envelope stress response protein [Eubacteriales bacterium]|nr:Asp23/Gls24 family envelope stress response protein [Eubacteriales bacterium]
MGKEEKNIYTLQGDENIGEVKIAGEVVASIAAYAAMDVKGVSAVGSNKTQELIGRPAVKHATRGVKIDIIEGIVSASITINVLYGHNLVKVTNTVQEKVKSSIENMTGLTVADVNVRVAGVDVPEEA